ncbi:helix-turn-helix transcriptional regulator [Streptomyces cinnamoneus]|uniref:helix-turn-helix domain-containing protein n=1 Tax=Streptomyces cinnamoneus TaxID=53446 RepID=UPI0033DAE19B
MDVRSAREIGAVIRGARCSLRLTQAEVGRACGYSASSVSRIESGQMHLGYVGLVKMAAVLDLALDKLGISPVLEGPAVDTVKHPADEEDAVRRRNLLTGALAAGATAVGIHTGRGRFTSSRTCVVPAPRCRPGSPECPHPPDGERAG